MKANKMIGFLACLASIPAFLRYGHLFEGYGFLLHCFFFASPYPT
jgi:hypothetical protein